MNLILLIFGIFAFGYGIFTVVIRILKKDNNFGKLEAMKKRFGTKIGFIIHLIAYSLLPIILGIIFIFGGIIGINIF